MGRKLLWLQWKTSHPPGAGRAHSAHQVPARETEPEDTAGAGCPARMLGSRLDTLKCQAGPEGSRGAEVTIRSVQDPRGAQTEEAGGFSITWCPRGCLGGVTPGIGSRLQQQDLASRCLQTAGQGSGQGAWEPRGLAEAGGPGREPGSRGPGGGHCPCFLAAQFLSRVQLSVTPWTAARQASLSIDNFWSSLKLMALKSVMPSNHLVLCCPLLLPPSTFPSIGVFSNESALCSDSCPLSQ